MENLAWLGMSDRPVPHCDIICGGTLGMNASTRDLDDFRGRHRLQMHCLPSQWEESQLVPLRAEDGHRRAPYFTGAAA